MVSVASQTRSVGRGSRYATKRRAELTATVAVFLLFIRGARPTTSVHAQFPSRPADKRERIDRILCIFSRSPSHVRCDSAAITHSTAISGLLGAVREAH